MSFWDPAGSANRAISSGMNKAKMAYADAKGMYSPYATQGGQAFSTIGNLMGLNGQAGRDQAFSTFQEDPGYQFAMDQGVSALDRSAAAKGSLMSGGQLKDLTTFGQGLANQQYGDWYNRLAGLADTGYSATGATANARLNLGQQQMQARMQQGENKANQTLGQWGMLSGLASAGLKAFA